MPLPCNIDKRGRHARLVIGIAIDMLGCGLVVAWVFTDHSALLGAGLAGMLGGSFMIFEGIVGWCALRALGFKTRL